MLYFHLVIRFPPEILEIFFRIINQEAQMMSQIQWRLKVPDINIGMWRRYGVVARSSKHYWYYKLLVWSRFNLIIAVMIKG